MDIGKIIQSSQPAKHRLITIVRFIYIVSIVLDSRDALRNPEMIRKYEKIKFSTSFFMFSYQKNYGILKISFLIRMHFSLKFRPPKSQDSTSNLELLFF